MTALMTPPFHLTLYPTANIIDDKVMDCFIAGLDGSGFMINSVIAEKSLLDIFVKAFTENKDIPYETEMEQKIFELKEVNPSIDCIGQLRLARESDLTFVPYWLEIFNSECFGVTPVINGNIEDYRYLIDKKTLYVLEVDGVPVTMAQLIERTPNICIINYVYTPPYHRQHGYASACVAALSKQGLKQGYKKCMLYTDLANPTSNSIYQKIGYQPVYDSAVIRFNNTAPSSPLF
jgi:GNAT superfamily N-acetyltransferase